jgi:glutaredoxin
MIQITDEQFLNIAEGKEDGIVILSTPSCVKCAALKKDIDSKGNPLNIVTYIFDNSHEKVLSYISENGYLSVPITFLSKEGEVKTSNEHSYDDIIEELEIN